MMRFLDRLNVPPFWPRRLVWDSNRGHLDRGETVSVAAKKGFIQELQEIEGATCIVLQPPRGGSAPDQALAFDSHR